MKFFIYIEKYLFIWFNKIEKTDNKLSIKKITLIIIKIIYKIIIYCKKFIFKNKIYFYLNKKFILISILIFFFKILTK